MLQTGKWCQYFIVNFVANNTYSKNITLLKIELLEDRIFLHVYFLESIIKKKKPKMYLLVLSFTSAN